MPSHEKIDYVEFPSRDLSATKAFFQKAFGWTFTDYGDGYTAFSNEGLDGGFFQADAQSRTESGAALIVFYSKDLEETRGKITKSGGKVIQDIFSFPGGRRFHFEDPTGNEYAVWSDR